MSCKRNKSTGLQNFSFYLQYESHRRLTPDRELPRRYSGDMIYITLQMQKSESSSSDSLSSLQVKLRNDGEDRKTDST